MLWNLIWSTGKPPYFIFISTSSLWVLAVGQFLSVLLFFLSYPPRLFVIKRNYLCSGAAGLLLGRGHLVQPFKKIQFLDGANISICARAAVSHSSVQYSIDYTSNHSLLSEGTWWRRRFQTWTRHRGLCGSRTVKRPEGLWPLKFPPGLRDGVRASPGANHADRFWAAPLSLVWKSALLPRQQRERLFKRNILSFSLIHCSWRFGTLLLNCSCYGDQRLYQQPFQRRSPCISRASSKPPTTTSSSASF